MKKKLYLANSLGFSKQTKKLLYEFINIFNDLNIEVYEPFERTKNIIQGEDNWAYDLAEKNFQDLKRLRHHDTPLEKYKRKYFYLEMI